MYFKIENVIINEIVRHWIYMSSTDKTIFVKFKKKKWKIIWSYLWTRKTLIITVISVEWLTRFSWVESDATNISLNWVFFSMSPSGNNFIHTNLTFPVHSRDRLLKNNNNTSRKVYDNFNLKIKFTTKMVK